MILNLFPENILDQGIIIFNIPVIHLDVHKDFELCLRKFYCKLSSSSKDLVRNSELWGLSSNLIDKCSTNIQQSISYFILDNRNLVTYYNPTSFNFYKIQVHNLESAQFQLAPAFREPINIQIKNCLLQVELRESK